MDKYRPPVWTGPSARLSLHSRIVRSDAFFGIFALLNIYALSTFFWRENVEAIVLWGDGLVPLSYADEGCKPMKVASPPLIVTASTVSASFSLSELRSHARSRDTRRRLPALRQPALPPHQPISTASACPPMARDAPELHGRGH